MSVPYLYLRVIEASNLASKDTNGFSDPFVRITLINNFGNEIQVDSSYVPKTLNPSWGENGKGQAWVFYCPQTFKEVLEIELFDYDLLSQDDPMGLIRIKLDNIEDGVIHDKWYDIQPRNKEFVSGSIHIQYQYLGPGKKRFTNDDFTTWSPIYASFLKQIFHPNSGYFEAMAKHCEIEHLTPIANGIVHLADIPQTLTILHNLIEFEVANTKSNNNLFRQNSLCTKIMAAFAKKHGHGYMKASLGAVIRKIINNPSKLEVKPDKITAAENLEENTANLLKACNDIFTSITSASDSCPDPFKQICHFIFSAAKKKFQNETICIQAVGAFIFLRVLCPCICAPDSYSIWHGPIPPDARRGLILIAKVLQNLANCIPKFGAKAYYLEPLNSFLADNKKGFRDLAIQLATVPEFLQSLKTAYSVYDSGSLLSFMLANPESGAGCMDIHQMSMKYKKYLSPQINEFFKKYPKVPSPTIQVLHNEDISNLQEAKVLEIVDPVNLDDEEDSIGEDPIILNSGKPPSGTVSTPSEVAWNLAFIAVKILNSYSIQHEIDRKKKGISKLITNKVVKFKHNGRVGSDRIDWNGVLTSKLYNTFQQDCLLLQKVDPTLLKDDFEKTCFWVNCYHILVFYSFCRYGSPSKNRFFSVPSLRIGKYELTLDAIQHGVLRNNSSRPKSFRSTFWPKTDPRNVLCVSQVDFRIHFVLSCLTESSPRMFAIPPRNSQYFFLKMCKEFINDNVTLHKQKLKVPKVFKWYSKDFKKRVSPDSNALQKVPLVTQLLPFINEPLKNSISAIPVNKVSIEYQHFEWHFWWYALSSKELSELVDYAVVQSQKDEIFSALGPLKISNPDEHVATSTAPTHKDSDEEDEELH